MAGKRPTAGLAVALGIAWAGLAWGTPVHAADPVRGAQLFAAPPAPGLLGCADCHSDNPVVNNFGNIWAGRNAVALIERAVQSNTGGMGYLREYRSAADLADIAAYLGNSPAAVQFAPTAVGGRSAAATVRVSTSTKAGAGAFAARTEGDFQIVGNDCGTERPRFDTCSLELVFAPTAGGERRGALLIAHDATPTPVRIALAGLASERPPAVARVEPQALDFGPSAAGLPGAQRVALLANDSAEPLTVSRIAVEGGFAVVGGDCVAGTVLARGQRCAVALRQEPGSAGVVNGRLVIGHDGAGGASAVALSGTVRGEAAARLVAASTAVDFGPTVGRGSATLRLSNAGTSDWRSIEIGALDGGFGVDAAACRAALPLKPGDACTLALSFEPPRTGRFSATLRLGGAGLEAPVELPLQGRGPDEAAAAPRWRADVQRLPFDAVPGRSSTREIRLRHDAATALAAAWRIDGADAGDFAVDTASTDCGLRLEPGASCRLALRFSPSAAGARQARLRVGGAGGGPASEPLVVPLAGLAAPAEVPRIAVDVVALSFAGAAPAAQRVVVSNPGPVDWRWGRRLPTGDHAGDFAVAGSCVDAPLLAAGARCEIEVTFRPSRPGPRSATLLLQPAGGAAVQVTLAAGEGRDSSSALPFGGGLGVAPDVLVFQAGPAGAGAGRQRTLRWRNEGATPLRIAGFELQGAGFETVADEATAPLDRCPAPPFVLQPGQGCSTAVRWPGSSAGAGGARLVALADDPWGGNAAELRISEDPAGRSNVGQGGGAPGAAGWWLALAGAVAALAASRRRAAPGR